MCMQHSAKHIKCVQGINFSQTQQFITQNILMATCFDSIESCTSLEALMMTQYSRNMLP